MVGSLLYLALRTRTYILASVLILDRFQKAPTGFLMRAAKQVMRYLRGTWNFWLTYVDGGIDIESFVDSDYASDVQTRKSRSGFLLKIGGALILWVSKRQWAVALSTCEAEYYAMVLGAQDVVWSCRLMDEIGMKIHYPVPVRSDNR